MSKVEITDEILMKACEAMFGSAWGFADVEMMRATLEAVAPMIASQERDRANAATAQAAHMADTLGRIEKRLAAAGIDTSFGAEIAVGRLAELRDAVRFLDRVKAASADERIAVGTDAWDRLEAAARKVVEIVAPPAEGNEP